MRPVFDKLGWLIAGGLAVLLAASVAGVVHGGPLDPPGAPAPSMQTLSHMPPDYVLQLNAANGDGAGCGSDRFECVLGSAGVLDHATGLVWQRDLSNSDTMSWSNAVTACLNYNGGGRMGWRLPTVGELTTLIDASVVGPTPSFPIGHPFTNLPFLPWYWANSLDYPTSQEPRSFWAVFMLSPGATPGFAIPVDSVSAYAAMCVRGAD